MSRFYTQTINLASILINIYQTKGLYSFQSELENTVDLIIKDCQDDINEASKRLTSLASNIFFSVLEGSRESVLNCTIELSDELKKVETISVLNSIFLNKFQLILQENESTSRQFSESVIQYLKTCSNEELKQTSSQILAENFDYSTTYFPKKFLEEQGTSIHDAIVYEKVNRAFKLLKDPDSGLSVKEVSFLLGFSDQRYFSKLFKSKFGVLPSEVSKLGR